MKVGEFPEALQNGPLSISTSSVDKVNLHDEGDEEAAAVARAED
jgi:hypothetical protein